MSMVFQLVAAAALLAVAFYAQHRIPFHTAGRSKTLLTRGVLASIGVALGALAANFAPERVSAALLFVQGFGLVHVPAALILFLKRARHERPS